MDFSNYRPNFNNAVYYAREVERISTEAVQHDASFFAGENGMVMRTRFLNSFFYTLRLTMGHIQYSLETSGIVKPK